MSALKPNKYYLTQLEHDMDNDSDKTMIFRTLSKDEMVHIKDVGEAPYKKCVQRERRVINKEELKDYPSLIDIVVLLDEKDVQEKSLFDDQWFKELVNNSSQNTH
ncbi:hypothetical protein POF51_25835 [Brevibacillus sp. AG]|uniref:hypothetical protein n=1 Tax=Brevibacillus sp. AG TaxID=3020891 RepID=UPI00232E9CA4|nr:hypothetical protein [Brevibacillus sp. AG]MDC0764144.1 hypothetical protein [Brevibacillus sp. AG]